MNAAIALKRLVSIGAYKCSKDFYKLVSGENHESMRISPKQNNSPPCGLNPAKVVGKTCGKKHFEANA